jgi:tetratricopeptide (TPR) repeat protein
MAIIRPIRLFYLSLTLVAVGLCLLACGSQEAPKEAAQKKAPPVSTPPATPAGVATAPKTTAEYIDQGKVLLNSKKFDQAIDRFTEAIRLDPKSIQAYNNRGIAYCNKGDLDRAIADFSRTIEIDPQFGKAYNNRAVAYFLMGERDKARQDAEKARSLGIPVNQNFVESVKEGETKAKEKGKAGAPQAQSPTSGKSKTPGKGETRKE